MDVSQRNEELLLDPSAFDPFPHVAKILEKGLEDESSLEEVQISLKKNLTKSDMLVENAVAQNRESFNLWVESYDDMRSKLNEISNGKSSAQREAGWAANKLELYEKEKVESDSAILEALEAERKKLKTALRLIDRIEKVINLVDAMERAIRRRQFKNSIECLKSINNLLAKKTLTNVSGVKGIRKRVDILVKNLTEGLKQELSISISRKEVGGNVWEDLFSAFAYIDEMEQAFAVLIERLKHEVDSRTASFSIDVSESSPASSTFSDQLLSKLRHTDERFSKIGTDNMNHLLILYLKIMNIGSIDQCWSFCFVLSRLLEDLSSLIEQFEKVFEQTKKFVGKGEAGLNMDTVVKLVEIEIRQILDTHLSFKNVSSTKTLLSSKAKEQASILKNDTVYSIFSDSAEKTNDSTKVSSTSSQYRSSPLMFIFCSPLLSEFTERIMNKLKIECSQLKDFSTKFQKQSFVRAFDKALGDSIKTSATYLDTNVLSVSKHSSNSVLNLCLSQHQKPHEVRKCFEESFPIVDETVFQSKMTEEFYVNKVILQFLEVISCIWLSEGLSQSTTLGLGSGFYLSILCEQLKKVLNGVGNNSEKSTKLCQDHFQQASVRKLQNENPSFEFTEAKGSLHSINWKSMAEFHARERSSELGLKNSLLSSGGSSMSSQPSKRGLLNESEIGRLGSVASTSFFWVLSLEPSSKNGTKLRSSFMDVYFSSISLLRSELRLQAALQISKVSIFIANNAKSKSQMNFNTDEFGKNLVAHLNLLSVYVKQSKLWTICHGISLLVADLIIRNVYSSMASLREAKFLAAANGEELNEADSNMDLKFICRIFNSMLEQMKTTYVSEFEKRGEIEMAEIEFTYLDAASEYLSLLLHVKQDEGEDGDFLESPDCSESLERISTKLGGALRSDDLLRLLQSSL